MVVRLVRVVEGEGVEEVVGEGEPHPPVGWGEVEPNYLHEVSRLNLDLAIAVVYGNNSGNNDMHVIN